MPFSFLAGCERTGTVRDAVKLARPDAKVMSCDLQPTVKPGPHYEGDIFDVIDYPWDSAVFHTPCTATSVSGARHFETKWNDGRQAAGVAFFFNVLRRSSHIKGRIFEQPVSIISTLYRKPDYTLQPWMFGDYETKATCLWVDGLVGKIIPIYKTSEECREALGIAPNIKPADRIHKMPPGPERANLRSATYPGIAREIARVIA